MFSSFGGKQQLPIRSLSSLRVASEEIHGARDTGDLEGKSEEQLTRERDAEGVQTDLFSYITWTGEIPPQKWMNFYTKIVSKFTSSKGVKLTVTFEAAPESGVSKQKVEEVKAALRELGLDPEVKS
jgi:hypothetical protein